MENKKKCAFCKEEKKLTKEHLWPNSLHKRLYAANEQNKNYFWLQRLQRDVPNEPTIKDVCANCNNEILSELDTYICRLFDNYFINIIQFNRKISFEYDYHLLKRWLLKMCYNSARIHSAHDEKALEDMLPYILGEDDKLGRSIQLFALLTYPEEVKKKEFDKTIISDEIVIVEPTVHRVGHILFRVPDIGKKILRIVHLRSFSFLLAFWLPSRGKAEQNYFESIIMSKMKGLKLLSTNEKNITLECIGIGAFESLKNARSQFEFSNKQ